jgi:hypothetical protein
MYNDSRLSQKDDKRFHYACSGFKSPPVPVFWYKKMSTLLPFARQVTEPWPRSSIPALLKTLLCRRSNCLIIQIIHDIYHRIVGAILTMSV